MRFKNLEVRSVKIANHRYWMCPFCTTVVSSRTKIHNRGDGGCGSALLSKGDVYLAYLKDGGGGLADTQTQAELMSFVSDKINNGEDIA